MKFKSIVDGRLPWIILGQEEENEENGFGRTTWYSIAEAWQQSGAYSQGVYIYKGSIGNSEFYLTNWTFVT